jgi:DNA-binding MarR family transcriptional regulator
LLLEIDEAYGLQKALTYRIARVSARLNRDGSHVLASAGGPSLTGWRILATVALIQKGTLADLREKTSLDKGTLSRGLAALEAQGLVSREVDKADRRAPIFALTATGRSEHRRILPIMQARRHRITSVLSEMEHETLSRLLARLEQGLADEVAE